MPVGVATHTVLKLAPLVQDFFSTGRNADDIAIQFKAVLFFQFSLPLRIGIGHKAVAFPLIFPTLSLPTFPLDALLLFQPGPMLSSCVIVGRPQVSGEQYILPVELVTHGLGGGEVVLPEPQG